MDLLRSRGHEAALFSMADPRGAGTPYDRHFVPNIDFKKPSSWPGKARLAAHAIYSYQARRRIRAMIADFRPDVAHVRNIYHHLSPSILWELKKQKVPIVYHVNDFKLLCASYNLVSRGEACEACRNGKFWHTFSEKCYPGWGQRIALVAEAYVHKGLGTYRKCVDCFLAPSQFVRDKFIQHGWDPARFEVLPHFQPISPETGLNPGNASVLYFGRLSPEKGVADLLRAMRALPGIRLIIAGEGPERGRLQGLALELNLSNVEFAGHLQGADLKHAIAGARFTILPSHAYETFGKTILESYAHSRAVVATDLGSRRELVQHGKTGLLYRTGDVNQLASAIRFLSSQPILAAEMGSAGREFVRQKHTPEAHYAGLMNLYVRLAEGNLQLPGAPRVTKMITAIPKPPGRSRDAGFAPIARGSFVPVQSLGAAALPVAAIAPPSAACQKPSLRVAFIGGRGLISKYSGIETYYEEVGERLALMGHEVTAYCRTYFTPPTDRHHGIKVVRLPTIRSKHLDTVLHTFLSTLHVLATPCDVVHYHALGPALFSFFPRLLGKKTVVTVQGLDWQRQKWGRIASAVLRLGESATVSLPNRTMVVSRALQDHYKTGHAHPTAYVPNGGVLRERRLPRKIFDWDLEPGNYILFLGRFSPEKGCHLLVEAYERLQTDTKLVMAGASSYCDDYARRLLSHAGDRIKILDWVSGDSLDELLTNAMLFVLPSDLEGLSLALLDAMGAGLCVLASDVAENREAVSAAGFTFRCGDLAHLEDRLRFLIANPAVRKASGQAAKRRVRENYQWSTVAAEIERLYFEVLGWEYPSPGSRKPNARVTATDALVRRQTG